MNLRVYELSCSSKERMVRRFDHEGIYIYIYMTTYIYVDNAYLHVRGACLRSSNYHLIIITIISIFTTHDLSPELETSLYDVTSCCI